MRLELTCFPLAFPHFRKERAYSGENLVPRTGLEPAASAFARLRSIQLSYRGKRYCQFSLRLSISSSILDTIGKIKSGHTMPKKHTSVT
jgi:hypothetical protein